MFVSVFFEMYKIENELREKVRITTENLGVSCAILLDLNLVVVFLPPTLRIRRQKIHVPTTLTLFNIFFLLLFPTHDSAF